MATRAAGVAIRELPASQLATYAAIPIAFRVSSRLVRDSASHTPDALIETPIGRPFDEDYDAVPGATPLDWTERYALERWGLLVADIDGRAVGRGTPAPYDPPRRLVTSGLYRFVRNPMYVAVVASIVAQAAWYGSRAVLWYGVGMALLFHLRVVLVEEPTLARAFGDEFAAYRARVPRWLPRIRRHGPARNFGEPRP